MQPSNSSNQMTQTTSPQQTPHKKITPSAPPLIHCITNPVTMNFVANAILSVGARPIMAEYPVEVPAIVKDADALLINIGTLSESKIESIRIALGVATQSNCPIVFDPVGVSGIAYRRQLTLDLIKLYPPTVIKGNLAEIKSLVLNDQTGTGVDSLLDENPLTYCKALYEKTGSTIVCTGRVVSIYDGIGGQANIEGFSPYMPMITGTGCMMGGVLAAGLGATADAKENATERVQTLIQQVTLIRDASKRAEQCLAQGEHMATFMVKLLDSMYQETQESV